MDGQIPQFPGLNTIKMAVTQFIINLLVVLVLINSSVAREFKFKMYKVKQQHGITRLALETLELENGLQIIHKDITLDFGTSKAKFFENLIAGNFPSIIWVLIDNNSDKLEVIRFEPMYIRVRDNNMAYMEPSIDISHYCDESKPVKLETPRIKRDRNLTQNREYTGIGFYYTIQCVSPDKIEKLKPTEKETSSTWGSWLGTPENNADRLRSLWQRQEAKSVPF